MVGGLDSGWWFIVIRLGPALAVVSGSVMGGWHDVFVRNIVIWVYITLSAIKHAYINGVN